MATPGAAAAAADAEEAPSAGRLLRTPFRIARVRRARFSPGSWCLVLRRPRRRRGATVCFFPLPLALRFPDAGARGTEIL